LGKNLDKLCRHRFLLDRRIESGKSDKLQPIIRELETAYPSLHPNITPRPPRRHRNGTLVVLVALR
jgi:hypothetical protein